MYNYYMIMEIIIKRAYYKLLRDRCFLQIGTEIMNLLVKDILIKRNIS